MVFRLFLLFTLVPALELWLLIRVGSMIGSLNTVLLILVTGAIGASLARSQGASVLKQINQSLKTMKSPGLKLIEGGLVLAGGLLLITPGICTDIVGFSMMIPPFRQALAPFLQHWFKRRFKNQPFSKLGETANPFASAKTEEKPPKEAVRRDHTWDHPVID